MESKSCLVVDDSPTIRKVVRRLLRDLELEIDDAENGQIALEKCKCRMPDIILLDWNMPVMNGIEFLRELRRTDGGTASTVILCTTESDVGHIREAFEAGANRYIMKPFDGETLRAEFGGLPQA